MSAADSSDASMLDLFRMETDTQAQVLIAGLLALERTHDAADQLEACMRAAHSLKGAARIVGLTVGVGVAHAMEDCFVAAQRGTLALQQQHIDLLLRGVDLLRRIANTPEAEMGQWSDHGDRDVDAFLAALTHTLAGGNGTAPDDAVPPAPPYAHPDPPPLPAAEAEPMPTERQPERAADPQATAEPSAARDVSDRVMRVTANSLNRLLGLAGESLVEAHWLKPFAASLLRLKRMHDEAAKTVDGLRAALAEQALDERAQAALADTQRRVHASERFLSERLVELEMFDRRSADLSQRLYDEALSCRMRPFADGVRGFPRLVRDLARSLGKQVKLEILGEATQVDRDILESLDAPLGHLLRNAMDHGIESPLERQAAGKPNEGVLQLEARHSAGILQVSVSDDGRGIDPETVRSAVVARRLINAEAAGALSGAELLEFLFLPGFTMKDTVTEISGRGVGLDVVQNMLKHVRGTVRVSSQPGRGTRFQLQLPVTLSVVRTLLVDVGGEPYALPVAHIVRALKLPKEKIQLLEGRQHFDFEGRQIGLVTAHQVLGGAEPTRTGAELSIVVVGDHSNRYGVVVDRFLDERELVVQPLDAQLGKIKDISAGALMADGSPVLIIDAEDMIRSVDKLVSAGGLSKVERDVVAEGKRRKRVLVVDDSLTVRELERKLLGNRGYEVETAVDGMDGWNAVRTGHFNLVVTDVDMPRMDGIELVMLIKKDPNLRSLPVMVVSYKDREEDRQRGLEAGADHYLTKGSFQDQTLLQSVVDLIGEAGA
jgi:two-component system, chemotaxis family, sensor histidine kinase and response regulator WspE